MLNGGPWALLNSGVIGENGDPADVGEAQEIERRTREGQPAAQRQRPVWCRALNRQHSLHPEAASGSLVMHKSANVITSHFGKASKARDPQDRRAHLQFIPDRRIRNHCWSHALPTYSRTLHLTFTEVSTSTVCLYRLTPDSRPASAPNISWKQHDGSDPKEAVWVWGGYSTKTR